MRIAYRKNVPNDHQAWDWWTDRLSRKPPLFGKGGFSHAELILDARDLALSATTERGIRLVTIAELGIAEHPDWWELREVEGADAEDEFVVELWARAQIAEKETMGWGYDWWGLMRFVLPWVKEHPHDWFCSEAVVAGLQEVRYLRGRQAWKISPNHLHRLHLAGELVRI
jgi:hypothetical protein